MPCSLDLAELEGVALAVLEPGRLDVAHRHQAVLGPEGMLLLLVNPVETVIDLPRHVWFETPDDLLLGQSLLDPPLHVVPRPGVGADPDHDDPPQRVGGDPVPLPGSAGAGWSCRRRPEAVPLRTAWRRPASLDRRSGLSPAATSRAPATSVRTLGRASNAGATAATTWARCRSSSAISALSAACRRARCRRASFVAAAGSTSGPRRNLAATRTTLGTDSPRRDPRSLSGEVSTSARSWLVAWALAFRADRRATRRERIISTRPSPALGHPLAVQASTARAAASASTGSLLPCSRRVLRSGRSTSTTVWPTARRCRAKAAP